MQKSLIIAIFAMLGFIGCSEVIMVNKDDVESMIQKTNGNCEISFHHQGIKTLPFPCDEVKTLNLK